MREWTGQNWPGGDLVGKAQCHLSRAELEEGWCNLPTPPRNAGEVFTVVVRCPDGTRRQPSRATLDPNQGLEGDRWAEGSADPKMQLAIMRADVAHLIANGQPPALFGDNLLVQLDLSEDNLPTGTILRIGTARCVVSAEPHNGCNRFAQRFGLAALALTADKRWRNDHLRGIYLTVITAGEVGPGDAIVVEQRP